MRSAMDPEPGDAIRGTMPDGREVWRYVTRTEMCGRDIYYAMERGGPEARPVGTWISSWRGWVRKRNAKIVAPIADVSAARRSDALAKGA